MMATSLTVDQAVAELAGAHLIVELVLGRAQVAQVLGRPRSLRDVSILFFASATLHYKSPPLQRHAHLHHCSPGKKQQRELL